MSYEDEGAELTRFDKLAMNICYFGAMVLLAVFFVFVKPAGSAYGALYNGLPSAARVVYTPSFAIGAAMLMVFLAYYGGRMRRMYNNATASNVLFFGICVAVASNGLMLYALFAPAMHAFDGL